MESYSKKDVFVSRRFSSPVALLLVPYAPIGLILAILRNFILLHAYVVSAILLPLERFRRLVLRIMCCVLGFIVEVDKTKASQEYKHLPVVTNHLSLFDHLILCIVQNCVTPHTHVFHWSCSALRAGSATSASEIIQRGRDRKSGTIHLLPEGVPSGNTKYLLKFDHTLFASFHKVQPVAITAKKVVPINSVLHPIRWPIEYFWQLFTPFTIYRLRYLTPISREPDEEDDAFAERVRKALAQALGATMTSFTAEGVPADSSLASPQLDESTSVTTRSSRVSSLSEIPESYTSSHQGSAVSSSSSSPIVSSPTVSDAGGLRYRGRTMKSPETMELIPQEDRLIAQVREVFNDVPLERVRRLLVIHNGDVEAVIDELLDNADDQVPCTTNLSADPNPSSSNSALSLPPSRLNTGAETFHTSSNARHTDLNDRKRIFLEHARQRYIANLSKHPASPH